ncbi:MAG: hypothetical protein ABIH26_01175 [Candidatus Eisenbacteria bacterium]
MNSLGCARASRSRPAVIALLVALFGGAAHAFWGDTRGAIGADGSFRSIPLYLDASRLPRALAPDGDERLVQNELRIVAAGRPFARIAYEIHAVQTVNLIEEDGGLASEGAAILSEAPSRVRYRALDLTSDWLEEEHATGSLSIDHLLVALSLDRADIVVGRQAITFGKAYFWNPLDVFAPFDPRRFDRDYKRGVDAARIDVPFGSFSGVTVVGVAGDRVRSGEAEGEEKAWSASGHGSALVGHVYTTRSGFDLAVQAGKVYGGRQAGGAIAGEIGPIEVRAEGAYLRASGDPDPLPAPLTGAVIENHGTFVLGLGRYYASTLRLEAEVLYNGLGDPDDRIASLARVAAGGAFHASRFLAGGLATCDITPIVGGSAAAIVSLDDGSFQVQPGLRWSTGDNSELLAGAVLNAGEAPDPLPRSEFGTYPDFYYAEFKVYF